MNIINGVMTAFVLQFLDMLSIWKQETSEYDEPQLKRHTPVL